MKVGICNEMFQGWELEKIFSFVKEVGYQGIEIAPFTLGDSVDVIPVETVKKIRELSSRYNLAVIGTHWLLTKPEGLSVSSSNKELRHKTAEYLSKLIYFTANIGGSIMVFGSPKQRNIQEGQTAEEVKENVKEVLKKVLKDCEKKNIFLCLEPLARTETNFINTAAEAIDIIEEMSHPYLKLHLDVKAMSDEQKPIPEIIKEGRKHLKHFHINDKNLGGPGSGDIDYKPIIDTLKEIGYDGWLSVEVFDFSPGPEVIAKNSINYIKKFL
ncbi:MAG: sugar phosphate isomerase/epimerase [Candidatus Ratteibacteria bacterium]|nr:sugar phosphate isomerase/epimerase [Candidatus Ratteibacteria bacterium]